MVLHVLCVVCSKIEMSILCFVLILAVCVQSVWHAAPAAAKKPAGAAGLGDILAKQAAVVISL